MHCSHHSDKLLSKVKMLHSQTLNDLNTKFSVALTCLEEDAFMHIYTNCT